MRCIADTGGRAVSFVDLSFTLATATATALLLMLVYLTSGCDTRSHDDEASNTDREVVIYTALDRIHSEPILRAFEARTGITVLAKYDVEAAKTTGLVNALITERNRPRCDVLWNNEMIQTQALADMGLFEPYASPHADRIPPQWRDPQARWTGFAARLRVIIYRTDLFDATSPPDSMQDFVDPRWQGQAAIAEPFFGTTFTHMLILHDQWGDAKVSAWWEAALANGLGIAPGNGPVRDLVVAGERAFGLTDTDDAYAAMQAGHAVAVTLPDAHAGAILIPNTVSLIRDAPHADHARKLIDYLLSPQVERKLAESSSAQIPLGTDLSTLSTPWDELLADAKLADINVAHIASQRQNVIQSLDHALGGSR